MKNLRVVFMGTPEFAVASLGALLINGYDVVSVVTSQDKPSGRGLKISGSAVKNFAESSYLPVIQPDNLKDQDFISRLKGLNADIFVIVAFRMLPKDVWKIPPLGTINLHASLLPQYRGAAPINHVIINGETITGVTTFLIDDMIDTGNILLREEVPILPSDNAGDLHDRLMRYGAQLVVRTLNGMVRNELKPQPQTNFIRPGELLHKAPRIFPEKCLIDWEKYPTEIHNFIRGLSPYPCAKSVFKNNIRSFSFKIFESSPENMEHSFTPGQVLSDGKNFIRIACNGGFVNILNLQLEGRRRMSCQEFLRGFAIKEISKDVIS
jgi:methionyl-tRNA formyltransferase